MLSQTQQKQFVDQGFLVLERFFSLESIARLRRAAVKIVEQFDIEKHQTVFSTTDNDRGRDDYFFDSAQAVHCFLEEDALNEHGQLRQPKALAINKIGHALHDLIPEFGDFCRQSSIKEVLRDIGYQVPQLWQTMYIFKQPRIGGEVRWHQDASYLITEPASVTGLWVALEDASQENGCLRVQSGGHRTALRERYCVDWQQRQGELKPLSAQPWPAEGQALETPAGSLVLFNDHLPHCSAPNHSGRSRQAFTMHVAESNADWSAQNWLQRDQLSPFRL